MPFFVLLQVSLLGYDDRHLFRVPSIFLPLLQVRNFPRLRFEPNGWRRVGSNPKDGSLRFFATLPEGLDFGTLQVRYG